MKIRLLFLFIIVFSALCCCSADDGLYYEFDIKIKDYRDINEDKKLPDSDKYKESAFKALQDIYVCDKKDEYLINPLLLNENYYNPYKKSSEKAYWVNKITEDEIVITGVYSIRSLYDILPVFMSEEFYNEFQDKIRKLDESLVYDLEVLYRKYTEEESDNKYNMLKLDYPELKLPRNGSYYLKRSLSSQKLPSRFAELYVNLGYSYEDTRKLNKSGGYDGFSEKYCIVEITLNKNTEQPIKYNIIPISPADSEYAVIHITND